MLRDRQDRRSDRLNARSGKPFEVQKPKNNKTDTDRKDK